MEKLSSGRKDKEKTEARNTMILSLSRMLADLTAEVMVPSTRLAPEDLD